MFQRPTVCFGKILLAIAASVGLLSASGCSDNQSAEREQSNLKPLAVFYGRYVGQHRGQTPPNEQEFRKFLEAMGKEHLLSMQVNSIDEVFVSSRDKKPYVVLYGLVSKTGNELPSATVVAYEQEGKGGKRFIARLLGAIEEVDEAKFKQIVPNAK
jgi:hypothetical protein